MRGFVASLGAAYIAYIVAAYVSTLPRAPSSRLPQADGLCSGVSTADRTAAVPLGPVVHVTVTLALAEALPGSGVEPVPKFDTKCQSSGLMWPPRGLITHIRKALDKLDPAILSQNSSVSFRVVPYADLGVEPTREIHGGQATHLLSRTDLELKLPGSVALWDPPSMIAQHHTLAYRPIREYVVYVPAPDRVPTLIKNSKQKRKTRKSTTHRNGFEANGWGSLWLWNGCAQQLMSNASQRALADVVLGQLQAELGPTYQQGQTLTLSPKWLLKRAERLVESSCRRLASLQRAFELNQDLFARLTAAPRRSVPERAEKSLENAHALLSEARRAMRNANPRDAIVAAHGVMVWCARASADPEGFYPESARNGGLDGALVVLVPLLLPVIAGTLKLAAGLVRARNV